MKNIFKSLLFFLIFFYVSGLNSSTAYITNNNNISIVDDSTNTVTGVINDPSFQEVYYVAVLPNGTKAYVANLKGGPLAQGSVSVVNTGTNTVIRTVTDLTNSFYFPQFMVMTPNGKTLYVINTGNNTISVVDTETDIVTQVISDVSFQAILCMAITPDGSKGYVTDYVTAVVSIIDIATNTITGQVDSAGFPFEGPDSVAVTPDGTTAYVGNIAGEVSIVDVATDTVTGFANDPDSLLDSPAFIVIKPTGTIAYVLNDISQIPLLTIANNTVTGIISSGFDDILYAAINPADTKMYVPNINNTVTIVDVTTNTLSGSVNDPMSTFQSPYSVAFFDLTFAPVNVSACKSQNKFLTQVDLTNVITWSPPTNGLTPTSYRIYRDAALTDLAGTVPATEFQFIDHNRLPDVTYTYYVVSVIDSQGIVSNPGIATASQNC